MRTTEGPPKRPNILILMTDQQRYDSLGCYGVDWVDTPNLDRLAAEGMLFENCYVNNPICTPSRASLFTGKEIPDHGVLRLHDILPDDEVLFPRHLQRLGYVTALIGKLHVSGRVHEETVRHPNDGFDRYEWCMEASISMDSPFNGYSQWLKAKDPEFHARLKRLGRKLKNIPREYHFTHWAAERTIAFIEEHDGPEPFFCMMSVFDPHNPYDDLPVEYLGRVDRERMPEPAIARYERHHTVGVLDREQRDGYLGPFEGFSDSDFTEMRAGYYGSLALLDDEVGRVLEALERKGIADDTLVIFLSDHGDMLGDHGLLVKGACFYEACVKVPLIIRQPGRVPAGTRVAALVQPHDAAATVLAAAGMERDELDRLMPDSADLRDAAGNGRPTVVCAYRQTGIDSSGRYFVPSIDATMITDGRWKLAVFQPEPGSDRAPEGQLFDLQNDPGELCSLWDNEAAADAKARLLDDLGCWSARHEPDGLPGRDCPRRAASAVPAFDELFDNRLKPG